MLFFSSTSSIAITAAFSINSIDTQLYFLLFTLLPIISGGSLIFIIMYKFYKFKIGKEDVEIILEELKPINNAICNEEGENGNE